MFIDSVGLLVTRVHLWAAPYFAPNGALVLVCMGVYNHSSLRPPVHHRLKSVLYPVAIAPGTDSIPTLEAYDFSHWVQWLRSTRVQAVNAIRPLISGVRIFVSNHVRKILAGAGEPPVAEEKDDKGDGGEVG